MHCKDTILRTQNNWPYSKLIPNSGKNEIQEIEKEALEERKSKAITLLQGLPNETLCEIVNHFEERLKTVGSENEEQ